MIKRNKPFIHKTACSKESTAKIALFLSSVLTSKECFFKSQGRITQPSKCNIFTETTSFFFSVLSFSIFNIEIH